MASQSVAQLLASLGVVKSHSRPHVSNDNPFSESQFKTMKYRPEFPDRFGGYEDALGYCRPFFKWYNDEHYHSGIGLLTPAMLHYGQAEKVIADRADVLQGAYAAHPERFVRGCPKPQTLPTAVWINPPRNDTTDDARKKRLPETHCPRKPDVSKSDAPLTHPRPGYPLTSCVPDQPTVGARLASVSPGNIEPNDSHVSLVTCNIKHELYSTEGIGSESASIVARLVASMLAFTTFSGGRTSHGSCFSYPRGAGLRFRHHGRICHQRILGQHRMPRFILRG